MERLEYERNLHILYQMKQYGIEILADEKNGLTAHPEHFMSVVTEDSVIGIEPFGMYGSPTMVQVQICSPDKLGKQIMNDQKADYPVKVAGLSTLTDKKTLVNSPVHQFKPTRNGFEAILAVYWPEHTIDEIVDGHCLHLAMEFYEGLKYIEQHRTQA